MPHPLTMTRRIPLYADDHIAEVILVSDSSRRSTCSAHGVCRFCSRWRVVGAVATTIRLAPSSRSNLGCAHRIHGLDLPAHPAGKLFPEACGQSILRRGFHRALPLANYLSSRPDTSGPEHSWQHRHYNELHYLRSGSYQGETAK